MPNLYSKRLELFHKNYSTFGSIFVIASVARYAIAMIIELQNGNYMIFANLSINRSIIK